MDKDAENVHHISGQVDDDIFKIFREISNKNNPFVSLAPVKQTYRAGDFYSFILHLGIERFSELSDEELRERGF